MQLVREAAARYGKDEMAVPPDVISDIGQRDWPGNVRELRNAADRFVLGLDGGGRQAEAAGLAERVAEFERGVIANALVAHGGSLKPVYESLGISRKTLYEKMQKYGLDKKLLVNEMTGETRREL
jgi:two-component system C4-dicarboxylate transport response regulator DctD